MSEGNMQETNLCPRSPRCAQGPGGMGLHGQHTEPETAAAIVEEAEAHFEALDHRGITPFDVDATTGTSCRTAGFVESLPLMGLGWCLDVRPHLVGRHAWATSSPTRRMRSSSGSHGRQRRRQMVPSSAQSRSSQPSCSFPLWWILASLGCDMAAAQSMPVLSTNCLQLHWLLEPLANLPSYLGVLCLSSCGGRLSAKAHLMRFFAKVVVSWRARSSGGNLGADEEVDWDATWSPASVSLARPPRRRRGGPRSCRANRRLGGAPRRAKTMSCRFA